jgi:hypothetical protein
VTVFEGRGGGRAASLTRRCRRVNARRLNERAAPQYDGAVGVAPRRRGGATSSRVGDAARVALAAIRIFNGAVGLFAPAMAARRIGTAPDAAPYYPWRLFGVRTVIIGAELLSRDPDVRENAVRIALPIHAIDTASAAVGGLLGETPKRTSVMLTLVSGINTVLALLARRTLR